MNQETDDNYLSINKNQIGPAANVTLKTKLKSLEDAIDIVADDLFSTKAELEAVKEEKENQEKHLKEKTKETKESLLIKLNSVEEDMKKHLNIQKEENNKLQKLITALKGEKTVLINKLIALLRRISDMEDQVGSDDLKYI